MKIISNYPRRFVLGVALACLPMMAFAQTSSPAPSQSGNSSMQKTQSGMSHDSMNSTKMSASDKKFVRAAAEGGLAEVELGKLATEKASSEDVKKFGQRMVDDHSKANDELKKVASNQGIELPEHLSAKDKSLKERLSKLDGASFDKAYMASMVKDHKADVADFEKESDSGKDTAIKQFATSTLPTLKDHLTEAERVEPTITSTRAAK
jgi:putative membrane protein